MPPEFYIPLSVFIAMMVVSAWFMGSEDKRTRNASRVAMVLGGTGVFISIMYFTSILIAAMIVFLPFALIAAWWGGLLESIGDFFSGLWS